MAKIPSDEIIDLVKRGESDVECIGDEFSMKYSSFDIAFGKYRDLLGNFELFERLDKAKIT